MLRSNLYEKCIARNKNMYINLSHHRLLKLQKKAQKINKQSNNNNKFMNIKQTQQKRHKHH